MGNHNDWAATKDAAGRIASAIVIAALIIGAVLLWGCAPEKETPCTCVYLCEDGSELERVEVSPDQTGPICEVMDRDWEYSCFGGECECWCDD